MRNAAAFELKPDVMGFIYSHTMQYNDDLTSGSSPDGDVRNDTYDRRQPSPSFLLSIAKISYTYTIRQPFSG